MPKSSQRALNSRRTIVWSVLVASKGGDLDHGVVIKNVILRFYGSRGFLDIPLGPKSLHYITLLFRINFPNYVIILYIAELVSNYFLGYVISRVVTKHTMWASDYITELFSN